MAVPSGRCVRLAWGRNMIVASLLMAPLWAGCGADGRYVVIGTARAQSASGTIEVDELDASSTQVSVHLEHLYPPNRLGRNLTRYGVWFVPLTGTPVWGGELKFDREERTGDLTATSPFRHFTVRITAEPGERSAAPSSALIVAQQIALE